MQAAEAERRRQIPCSRAAKKRNVIISVQVRRRPADRRKAQVAWLANFQMAASMTSTPVPDSNRRDPSPAFDMIVFGGTGDLAMRKLMPALMHRDIDGRLHCATRIIGIGRSAIGNEAFAKRVEESCRNAVGAAFTEQSWANFARRLHYLALNASNRNDYGVLRDFLDGSASKPSEASITSKDQRSDALPVRVFYLATDPDLFGPTSQHLGESHLVTPNTRVVLEKPIGHDLASSRAINDAVGAVFREDQIFRIDHYLGKEAV
ncbi:MAG TPA: hypothetical protein VF007_14040, partial [Stellaceae bacterium]